MKMKNRSYLIDYKLNDQGIEDILNTLELLAFLIYAKFNKKIKNIEIKENYFLEEDLFNV